ncbi:pentraxin fusion protein-like [Dendropsophus ebraccatus]|uniref:pentraxin fusion protein-like n=1 Tax=Dendropsophus ebraccatus TaxID=150705 RepID=UPI003831C5F1
MLGIVLLALGVSIAWAERCTVPIGVRNHAKHAVVSQSSTHVDSASGLHLGPELATDGNNDNKYSQGSCSQTKMEYEPWFNMDMKHRLHIGTVAITNRGDCCPEQLMGAEILVGDSKNGDNQVCGVISDVSQATIAVCCNGMAGQYLSVRIPGREEQLSMCEVEVYEQVDAPNVHPEEVIWSE